MKKTIILPIFLLTMVAIPTVVLAQGQQAGQQQGQQEGTQQRVQDPTLHEDDETVTPISNQQGQMGQQAGQGTGSQDGSGAGAANRGIGASTQSLNRVAERNNNPEIGEQVRAMVENHQQVQAANQTAIQTMSQRGKVKKFFLGPDYKNAGEVRSNVVGLRNDIDKLKRMQADLDEEDTEDIQAAINQLEAEANDLDAQLEEQLSGFSLFGWLAKRFAD